MINVFSIEKPITFFSNLSDFFSENLNFGEVQVNGIKYAIYLPHGGIKESGIGHDCSHLALYDYLTKKQIVYVCRVIQNFFERN